MLEFFGFLPVVIASCLPLGGSLAAELASQRDKERKTQLWIWEYTEGKWQVELIWKALAFIQDRLAKPEAKGWKKYSEADEKYTAAQEQSVEIQTVQWAFVCLWSLQIQQRTAAEENSSVGLIALKNKFHRAE